MAKINWGSFDSDIVHNIKASYDKYGRFGDDSFHGDNITLRNTEKWLQEAGILGNKVSSADTGITFKRILGNEQKTMPFDKFKDFISDLAQSANPANPADALKEMVAKLQGSTTPSTTNTTHSEKSDVVERLTDPAGYTGTQRFSADGKAVEGKKELADQSQVNTDGYVSGYKNAETYDKDHSVTVAPYDAEAERKRVQEKTGGTTDIPRHQTNEESRHQTNEDLRQNNTESNRNSSSDRNVTDDTRNATERTNRTVSDAVRDINDRTAVDTRNISRPTTNSNRNATDNDRSAAADHPRANADNNRVNAESTRTTDSSGNTNASAASSDISRGNADSVRAVSENARSERSNVGDRRDVNGSTVKNASADQNTRSQNPAGTGTDHLSTNPYTGGNTTSSVGAGGVTDTLAPGFNRATDPTNNGSNTVDRTGLGGNIDSATGNTQHTASMVTGSGRATDTTTSGAARSTVTENSGNANRSPARTGESDLHSPIADNRTAARNDIITDTRHPTQNQTSPSSEVDRTADHLNNTYISQDKAQAAAQQRSTNNEHRETASTGRTTENRSDSQKRGQDASQRNPSPATLAKTTSVTDHGKTVDTQHGPARTDHSRSHQTDHTVHSRTDTNRHRAELDARDTDTRRSSTDHTSDSARGGQNTQPEKQQTTTQMAYDRTHDVSRPAQMQHRPSHEVDRPAGVAADVGGNKTTAHNHEVAERPHADVGAYSTDNTRSTDHHKETSRATGQTGYDTHTDSTAQDASKTGSNTGYTKDYKAESGVHVGGITGAGETRTTTTTAASNVSGDRDVA